MASKNAPKSLLISPSFEATVANEMVKVGMNSSKTAHQVEFTVFVGECSTHTSESGKTWTTAGEVTLPDTIEIDGQKYWINLSSGWIDTKQGRRKVGKPRISLSPVKEPKKEEAKKEEKIPW